MCLCVHVYIYFHMEGRVYMPQHVCGDQRTALWIWISPGIFVSLLDQVQIFKLVTQTFWLTQSAHQPETLLKKNTLILYFEDRVSLSFLSELWISYIDLGSPWIYFTVCLPQPPEWLRIYIYLYIYLFLCIYNIYDIYLYMHTCALTGQREGSTLDQYST